MSLIFIVEDHDIIRKGIGAYLENSGFRVKLFANLSEIKKAMETEKPDLIVQDIMLPDGDGAQFIQDLLKTCRIPVIFMTAKTSEADRIHGFEVGADDYITKPFSPKELVLRVQAVLRRSEAGLETNTKAKQIEATFVCDSSEIFINEKDHKFLLDGKELSLTAAEWRILVYLISNRDSVISRNDILRSCFNYWPESYDRIADTHIKNIRAKLGSSSWIETIRGFGYKFVGREKQV